MFWGTIAFNFYTQILHARFSWVQALLLGCLNRARVVHRRVGKYFVRRACPSKLYLYFCHFEVKRKEHVDESY